MNYRQTFLLIISVFACSFLFARNNNLWIGSRSAALANASVVLADVWAVQHNQAGLATLKSTEIGLYANRNSLLPEASQFTFAAASPFKFGTLGLNVSRYGFKNYNESKVGLAYARTFGPSFRAGMMASLLQTSLGDIYGSGTSFALEAGIQAKLVNGLWIGTHIFNINRARAAEFNNERIPTIFRLGLLYQPSDKVFATAEIEQDLQTNPIYKAGMEYSINKAVKLRAGFRVMRVVSYAFGAGINWKGMNIDLSASLHPQLGVTPHTGIGYQFMTPQQ